MEQQVKSPFKVDFNIYNYDDILPKMRSYLEHDLIINQDDHEKGRIENMIWRKYTPEEGEESSSEFRSREVRRILRTGAWIWIKDYPVWLPPNYYFALQYGSAGSLPLEFRLKRLKHVYFKIRARQNANCLGTFTVKNRGDGETTMAITDGLWECMDGNMDVGQIGIQSKTREDSQNPCWMYVQTSWQSLPQWLKDEMYSDFSSGENIAEKLRFQRSKDLMRGARNVMMRYYPAVFNAMDGKHDVRRCLLDEVLKWVECDFGDTLINYMGFIMPGFERKGLFDMFSTPADKDCRSYRDGHSLWEKSDPAKIDPATGVPPSRIHRYYSNPLEGIHGAYDEYGDVDANQIYDFIQAKRKAADQDKRLAEIRQYPLNEEEMWGSLESSDFFDNHKGIAARKVYLLGRRFKDEKTKEPTVVYGNLEWPDGVRDSGDPLFRQANKNEFDVYDARFCFSYLPKDREPLRNIFKPPAYVENCLGIDGVDKRYPGKKHSNFAMVNHKFRDIRNTGINKCPTMIYCSRPLPIEISFEDAIKAVIFNRSMAQAESLNSNVVNYFEDRGYIDWMISKIGMAKNSLIKGDAPAGKSAFIDEIVGLLNAITNVPINDSDPYLLDMNWFYELLDDVSRFNKKDTHENDLSMAWGQALMGAAKLMFKKVRQPSSLNFAALDYLLS